MKLLPQLQLGLLNGWLPFIIYVIVFGITIYSFSKDVRARLYDRSLWTDKHRKLTALGKLFTLINLVLFIFTPLKLNGASFIFGIALYILGLLGLINALITYSKTPMNTPVTKGLYKVSRNPQVVCIWLLFAGICFLIGSWLSLMILIVSVLILHQSIIAEEQSCIAQYGESYKDFMKQVPRYFLFF